MKRILLPAVLLFTVAVGPAAAVIDPAPNSVGLYFDATGDNACAEVTPYTPLTVYLILANPTPDVRGFSVGCHLSGNAQWMGTVAIPGHLTLEMVYPDNITYHFVPSLAAGETCRVMATMNLLYTDIGLGPVALFVHGSTYLAPDPALPTLILADDTLVSAGTSTPPGTPAAVINGECVVADEAATWDGVKSLYR